MSRTRPHALLLAAAVTAALASGCGGSGSSDPSVARADLEKEVSSQLEKQVGQAPDKIECPGELKGTKGTTERCTLTAGSDTYGLTVTVTSVDGDKVGFDIKVDDQPQS